MNTSYNWIKAYVPGLDAGDREYADAMTLSGTKVESFSRLDNNLEKIVVGQVLKIDKHPDADHLIICQVNVGAETIQIVTGAPNVFAGAKVPVVLVGGKVAGGHDGGPLPEDGIKIKKGKLRGVESYGMMCSIEELGSSREYYPEAPENGIYIFPDDVEVGQDAVEVLGLHDTVFEYEITSNRVDCYSLLGIAREAAATFRKDFVPPAVGKTGNSEDASDYIKVRIEAPDLCSRFCARIVKNIKLGPSPEWMRRRLASAGIRPINNLVDITNYVMVEYGQPMHAYDWDHISGHEIVVRRAEDGEEFQTLDGQVRKLDHDMLMICDGEKEVGLAGIMGGENSKITDDVTTMLLEAACFNGTNIRLSAKRLGLRTDASSIFEKGLDPNNTELAINRACQLVEELGAGEVVGGMVDVYPEPWGSRRIAFRPDWINSFIGTDVDVQTMKEYFSRLDLGFDEATQEVIVPSFRQDLEQEADIAEEVARFFGYDNIPTTLPRGEATTGKLSFKQRIEAVARQVAEFSGFSQAMTYSFESPKVFDKLLLPEDAPERNAIRISNPLGEEFSIMRTLPLNGILSSLATNYNRRNKAVSLYEMGNIYIPKSLPLTELPDERMQLTLGSYDPGYDFFALKGVVEEFFDKIGLSAIKEYRTDVKRPFLHPGRQAEIWYDGTKVGYMGELHPQVADNYGIGERACIAVLDMPAIIPHASFDHKYTGIARFPASSRDISMVMKKDVTAGEVESVIRSKGGRLLESCELFDIYEGKQIMAGFKSMAYNIVFRAPDRTLEDREVNEIMDGIISSLKEMGIELRA